MKEVTARFSSILRGLFASGFIKWRDQCVGLVWRLEDYRRSGLRGPNGQGPSLELSMRTRSTNVYAAQRVLEAGPLERTRAQCNRMFVDTKVHEL